MTLRVLRRALLVVLVATFGWNLAAMAQPQGDIDIRTYLARLSAADALAQRGVTSPSPDLMDAVAAALGLPVRVQVGDRVVHVSFDPVLSRLTGDLTADFSQAHARLIALISEARLTLQSPQPGEQRLAEALNSAYRDLEPHDQTWFDRLRRAIGETLLRALSNLITFSGIATILEWLVILVLILVAVQVLRKARLVPDRRQRPARIPRPRSPGDFIAGADRAISSGDLVGAVRLLYRALLAGLVSRGITPDTPSLTAGECRELVSSALPALYPRIAPATLAYERITYGMRDADRDALETLRRAAVDVGSA